MEMNFWLVVHLYGTDDRASLLNTGWRERYIIYSSYLGLRKGDQEQLSSFKHSTRWGPKKPSHGCESNSGCNCAH